VLYSGTFSRVFTHVYKQTGSNFPGDGCSGTQFSSRIDLSARFRDTRFRYRSMATTKGYIITICLCIRHM
jgi:hypothetical protein